MSAISLRCLSADAFIHEIHTRMPFRYGNACLTASPVLTVRVEIEADGRRAEGFSSDCLPPRWFDKDPSKEYRQNVEDQISAYRSAREVYLGLSDRELDLFALWSEAFPPCQRACASIELNALTASFGSSFFERALIDALCRTAGISFHDALARNLLGLDTRSHLPNSPLDTIGCRHTVGLADPIRSNEVPTGERLHDGLPQALDECIQFYGLRYFKVKVCGDHDQDLDRLGRMADLFNERCPNGFSISLDGNEQYRDLTLLNSLLEALRSRENGERFVENVLYIEQPLGRDLALDASAASGIAALSELRPVIIDESDDLPDSFERATKLGYRGTSHKNCKGIFKSLRNLSLAKKLNTETGGENYFLSAEDLANTAVLPLQQDLSTVAALGIPHAERNGHHYFRCLDHLPRDEAEETAAKHESLYTRRGDSIGLDVTNGLIDVSSLRCAGYGYASRVDVESRTPLDEWDFAQLGT